MFDDGALKITSSTQPTQGHHFKNKNSPAKLLETNADATTTPPLFTRREGKFRRSLDGVSRKPAISGCVYFFYSPNLL